MSNWSRLTNYKCPMCNQPLKQELLSLVHECTSCSFVITNGKFHQIVTNRYRKKPKVEGDNFELLNNLGHDQITEDFGDSPYADRL